MTDSQKLPGRGGESDGRDLIGKNPTATATVVLAVLTALLYAVITAVWLSALVGLGFPSFGLLASWLGLAILAQIVSVVLLAVGGIRMTRRKRSGRTWVLVGSGLAVVLSVVGFLTAVAYRAGFASGGGLSTGPPVADSAIMSTVFYLVPAAVTLVLALLPPTRRWCTA